MTSTTVDTSPNPDGDGLRDRIITAARSEFAAYGFKGASVRTIANGAGATPAMINYYFRGKFGLYREVVEEAFGRLRTSLASAMVDVTMANAAPKIAAAYFDFLSEDSEYQRLLAREVLDEGQLIPDYVREHIRPLRVVFESHFGKSDAVFQAGVSLFGAVAGYFLYAPVIAEMTGEDPLAHKRLQRRRRHIMALAESLSAEATPAKRKTEKKGRSR